MRYGPYTCNSNANVFETPRVVPILPTMDQLYNHGKHSIPRKEGAQKSAHEHNKFKGLIKCFRGLQNLFAQQINFLGTPKYLWGSTIIFQAGI